MKSATKGITAGCIIWILVFVFIGICVLPVAAVVGGISSGSDFAVRTVGPMVCPDNTTPRIHTYATTTIDDNGFETPATGFEIQCFNASGEIVKTDPIVYAFIWIGILSGIGLVLTGILAFILATPAGIWLTRILERNKNKNQVINIDPQ